MEKNINQSGKINTDTYSNAAPGSTADKLNQMSESNKPKKEDVSHKIGDSIERLGEKITQAGAEKLGKTIYKAGNKIEHMNDDKH
jgi:hypothetical protein